MSNKKSLIQLVESKNEPFSLLEIGVAQGASAIELLNSSPHMQYTGLDAWIRRPGMKHEVNKMKNWSTQKHWDDIYQKVVNSLAKFGDRARIIRGDSHEILPTLDEKFDIIFVDGDHSFAGCLKDLEDSFPLLAEGGVMWVDDVDYISDVKRALNTFARRKDVAVVGGVMLKRK